MLAIIAALLGIILYAYQSYIYAHRIPSTLDEGNYLYKGLLFLTGKYFPFQDYGVWTNKMPFSFFIPGLSQLIDPGLRSGRYFAILLGVLMLVGLWITGRRLGGYWWAAFVVMWFAVNPIIIKMYSQMLSEGLIAFLLAWVFVFSLGQNQKTWQTILGTLLAALLILSRQNMLPLIIIILCYYLWEHGWKNALINTIVFLVAFLIVHIVFWPGILQLWIVWIPKNLSPYLDSFRLTLGGTSVWNPQVSLFNKLFVFWEGTRHHLIPLLGTLVAWIFWPKKGDWKSPSHYRMAIILSVLFAVMVISHAWASIDQEYCVFCYSLYLSFFTHTGLLIIVLVYPSLRKDAGFFRQALALILTLIIASGVAFGGHQDVANFLMNIQVPRMQNMRFLPGTTEVWRFLANKFGYSMDTLKVWIPVAAGLLLGLSIVLLMGIISYTSRRKKIFYPGIGYLSMITLLLAGLILTPTPALGGGNKEQECGDVIRSYEDAGNLLRTLIPKGALVYWYGGLSPVPLLYLPDVRIFPPQLNDGYSFRNGGDPEQLERNGYWNESLSDQWMLEADYVLLEGRYYKGKTKDQLENGPYYELSKATEAILKCEYKYGTEIRIFRRVQ